MGFKQSFGISEFSAPSSVSARDLSVPTLIHLEAHGCHSFELLSADEACFWLLVASSLSSRADCPTASSFLPSSCQRSTLMFLQLHPKSVSQLEQGIVPFVQTPERFSFKQ